MGNLWQDVRFAGRVLARNPGFTAVAVLALALGIGANTAIFSVVNAVLLRPLPYKEAGRLTVLWETNHQLGVPRARLSGPNFLDWREYNQVFQDMAAHDIGSGTLTGLGEPEQIPGMRVTTNFLRLLGAEMALGRGFAPEEGHGGRRNVLVLSHGIWQRRFGSDPNIIGRKLTVDGLPYTVVGVLSPKFWFPLPCDGVVPWDEDELRRSDRSAHFLGVIARLRPGVSLERARAEMNAIARRIEERHLVLKGWGATVVPMQEALVEYIRPALLVLLGAVGFVLLIACANVANLLLVRAATRQKELAVRMALGAGRFRLLRQLLTESVLLGVLGGALGLLLAFWGVRLLAVILPGTIPIPDASAVAVLARIQIDGWVLAFTLGVSLLSGALFGLAPALHAARTDVAESLKQAGRSAAAAGHRRVRGLLVVAETGLALVLLIGSALMLKSFWKLQRVDPGFQAGGLLTMEMELPTDSKYREPRQRAEFFRQVLERVETLPGVRSVGVTAVLPLDIRDDRVAFVVEGHTPLPAGQRLVAYSRRISPDYLKAMGIPLRKGRFFTAHDNADAPRVAIIDETLARRYFPDEDPIGRRLITGTTRTTAHEIVGVTGAVMHTGVDKKPQPTAYFPQLQAPSDIMNLVVRAQGDPKGLTRAVKQAVWAVDKDQPVYQIRTMEEVIAESRTAPRLTLSLLAAFTGVAVVLAAIGIYGVVAYSVSQRTQEIGMRMAMGARPGDVLGMVLRQAAAPALVGILAGLGAAVALTRFLSTLLYEVSATDPLVFAGVSALLVAVALAASYLPAQRAAKVDPMVALRHE